MSFLQMFPEEVPPHLQTLTALAESLGQSWRDGQAAVEAGEGGFGNDALAAAFTSTYHAAKQALETVADQIPQAFEAIAAGGRYCVQDYRAVDDPAPFQALR
jgi:hypothetical protein